MHTTAKRSESGASRLHSVLHRCAIQPIPVSNCLTMRILVLICTMLSQVAYGQTPTMQVWISGDLTVTTSESLTLTAVKVKGLMHRDSIRSGDHHVSPVAP
jgi:hypothetical protein